MNLISRVPLTEFSKRCSFNLLAFVFTSDDGKSPKLNNSEYKPSSESFSIY